MVGGVGTDYGLEGEGCCADVEGGGGLVYVCGGAVWACFLGGDGGADLVWGCDCGFNEGG